MDVRKYSSHNTVLCLMYKHLLRCNSNMILSLSYIVLLFCKRTGGMRMVSRRYSQIYIYISFRFSNRFRVTASLYRSITIILRQSSVGRTTLDEREAERKELYLTTGNKYNTLISMQRRDSNAYPSK